MIACLLAGCDDEPPSPEGLCLRAASCEPMELLVSNETCAQQVRQRIVNASPECSECVLGLPCSGMARVASGKVSLSQICPACPSAVTSQGGCKSGHEHVLICGIATRPPPAPSGSASASAPPATATAAAAPPSSATPAASIPTALPPLPTVPRLPTVPVPPVPTVPAVP
ncbi:MAG: hypothetical protein QM820_08940 [Minicystis sp.]